MLRLFLFWVVVAVMVVVVATDVVVVAIYVVVVEEPHRYTRSVCLVGSDELGAKS